MRMNKKALLAAGLLAGAAAMTGCAAEMRPAATPTPQAAQQATAEPATAQPAAEATQSPEAGAEDESGAPIHLLVDGKEADEGALAEGDALLLPLRETAELLGWTADSSQTEEEGGVKRIIALEKEGSRITVSWTVSDNTAKGITWQKDGLLIPVDTRLTTIGETVYVPAAFFEEAMEVSVLREDKAVAVHTPKPKDTPPMQAEGTGETG
ncbi:MAG: hypothetical protein IJN79_00495 [Clostridia bacterium]|nr:hypothetical protein [Clostridia bacterium]MBQ7051264.1 hypothetical protein [Clostridia bacterium]